MTHEPDVAAGSLAADDPDDAALLTQTIDGKLPGLIKLEVQAGRAMRCLPLVPGFSLIYCDPAQTEGCSAPIRGVVKVMT